MLGKGTLQLNDKWGREDATALAERIRSIEVDILNVQTEVAAISGAVGALIINYTQPLASDVSTYFQALTTPYAIETSATCAGVVNGGVVANWITPSGSPGITFIPAGEFEIHLHAAYSGGTGLRNYQLFGELWETNASGGDIAKIGTSENTDRLTTSEAEYRVFFATSNVYTMASASSRVDLRVKLLINSGGSPTVVMFMGGEADSHFSLPTNISQTGTASIAASATDSSRLGGNLPSSFLSVGGITPIRRAIFPAGMLETRSTPVSSWMTFTQVQGTNFDYGQLSAPSGSSSSVFTPPILIRSWDSSAMTATVGWMTSTTTTTCGALWQFSTLANSGSVAWDGTFTFQASAESMAVNVANSLILASQTFTPTLVPISSLMLKLSRRADITGVNKDQLANNATVMFIVLDWKEI
jgi:hypothetical protein